MSVRTTSRSAKQLTLCCIESVHCRAEGCIGILENTPPEAQEISLGRGFCTPRPERLHEGYTV